MNTPQPSLLLLLSSLCLVACAANNPQPVDESQAADAGALPETDWLTLEFSPGALASDLENLYVGAGSEILSVNHDSKEQKTVFDYAPEQKHAYAQVMGIYVGESALVVVVSDGDLSDPLSPVDERSMWIVPKVGGPAIQLSSSSDSRAFLGAVLHGEAVYYSTYTALYKVPMDGGESQFVAESPNSTQYWILSPNIVNNAVYWAEGDGIYQMPLGESSKEGEKIAGFPSFDFNSVEIVSAEEELAMISWQGLETTSMSELNLATGAVTRDFDFESRAYNMSTTRNGLWATSFDGLLRVDRITGERVVVDEDAWTGEIASTEDLVFYARDTSIIRIED